MVAKKTTKKPAKLSVKKSTVKDLDVKPGKAGGVKGGAATADCETRMCLSNRPTCSSCFGDGDT